MGIIKVTNDNYKEQVGESTKPVLLDFYANWCGPCKMVSPILEEIAQEMSEEIQIGKVNVDEEGELAQNFKVMSIPMLVLVKDGEVIHKLVGAQSKQAILDMIKNQ